MRSKSTLILLLVVFGVLAVAFAPFMHRAFMSTLVLSELVNFPSKGWLDKWTPPPTIQEFTHRGSHGITRADLYISRPGRKGPGILLNHGVIDTGKDDPRLKRFAEILCRAGFVVCVPDFKGMRSFRISPADIDEIQAAFERLISLKEHILPESCGLFGFSYGAGPTIIAACRPEIRQKVRFVVSFGGYYDLKNVLSFMATGNFEFAGKRYFRKPQEYGKWVFLANNLDLVESSLDRAVLREILKIKLRDENAPVDRFLPELGGEGRNILNLLTHANPSQTESFIEHLPPSVRSSMTALSVSASLKDLDANLILAHGEDDDLIPFTETLRLAQAAPDPRKVHCQILKIFSHVDPEQMHWTMKNLIYFYLPEGWKLFGVVYQLMSYR